MFDDEGHWLDDPLDIVNGPEPDFKGMGLITGRFSPIDVIKAIKGAGWISEHRAAVFADIEKMVSHLAKVHNLHQDEIGLLLADWFNEQPGCLKVNINL